MFENTKEKPEPVNWRLSEKKKGQKHKHWLAKQYSRTH
jgi:hypothetical protein